MASLTSSAQPVIQFHTLPQADGSARYEFQGFIILCTVNGPIEAQRRDELPEEAFVEIILREATGPGGPRDRLLESLLHRTLLPLIHTKAHPRTLVQITLQLLKTPKSEYSTAPPLQSDSILPALPHLFHAAMLALLDGNIPMLGYGSAAVVSITDQEDDEEEEDMDVDGGTIVVWPTVKQLANATSVHVVGFDASGALLLVESEGEFDMESWERAVTTAKTVCTGKATQKNTQKGTKDTGLLGMFRELVAQNVIEKTAWKSGQ